MWPEKRLNFVFFFSSFGCCADSDGAVQPQNKIFINIYGKHRMEEYNRKQQSAAAPNKKSCAKATVESLSRRNFSILLSHLKCEKIMFQLCTLQRRSSLTRIWQTTKRQNLDKIVK